jgi:hypothetical protein
VHRAAYSWFNGAVSPPPRIFAGCPLYKASQGIAGISNVQAHGLSLSVVSLQWLGDIAPPHRDPWVVHVRGSVF